MVELVKNVIISCAVPNTCGDDSRQQQTARAPPPASGPLPCPREPALPARTCPTWPPRSGHPYLLICGTAGPEEEGLLERHFLPLPVFQEGAGMVSCRHDHALTIFFRGVQKSQKSLRPCCQATDRLQGSNSLYIRCLVDKVLLGHASQC